MRLRHPQQHKPVAFCRTARKWKLNTVSKQWAIDSSEMQARQDEQKYPATVTGVISSGLAPASAPTSSAGGMNGADHTGRPPTGSLPAAHGSLVSRQTDAGPSGRATTNTRCLCCMQWMNGFKGGWMDGWMDGCMDGRTSQPTNQYITYQPTNEWTEGGTDGWVDRWMEGGREGKYMAGWVAGWTDG
eukprot:scaffold280972_cov26-Prasinocladus_malaysianus.AAC.2